MEKPVGVDTPVGIRSILASSELAKSKGLGHRGRHPATASIRVHRADEAGRDGAIGEIVAGEAPTGTVRACGPTASTTSRSPAGPGWRRCCGTGTSMCGCRATTCVEQHVHNLDVVNWRLVPRRSRPWASAAGNGGSSPQYGNIFDQLRGPLPLCNGAVLVSMARQINDTQPLVTEGVIGTKGRASAGLITGPNACEVHRAEPEPLRAGTRRLDRQHPARPALNEGRAVAEATLTASWPDGGLFGPGGLVGVRRSRNRAEPDPEGDPVQAATSSGRRHRASAGVGTRGVGVTRGNGRSFPRRSPQVGAPPRRATLAGAAALAGSNATDVAVRARGRQWPTGKL